MLKSRKYIIISMFITCIMSLVTLVFIEFIGIKEIYHSAFLYDVCLALFGSSLILVVASLIEFVYIRKTTMEAFYQEAFVFRNMFGSLDIYKKDGNSDNFEQLLKQYINCSKVSIVNLDNLYGQLHFIYKHTRKQKWVYKNLYEQITNARKKILEAVPHFENYLKPDNVNKAAVSHYLIEIQNYFFKSKITFKENRNCRSVYNKVSDPLDVYLEIFRKNIYGKWSGKNENEIENLIFFYSEWDK